MNRAEVRRRQAEAVADILALITVLVMGRLIGNNGVAYVLLAVEVYLLLWSVVGGNLSDTLGKLLRGRKNKGRYNNVVKMRRGVMIFHGVLGLLGSLVLFFLAGTVAEGIFHLPYSTLILRVLSPAVLLRSVSAILTGFFQGEGTEFPGTVVSIMRQILTLVFGIVFSGLMGGYGEMVSALLRQDNYTAMYGGVGFAIAISLAELFVIIFLALVYRGSRRQGRNAKQDAASTEESMLDGVRYLCMGRWQQALTDFLACLPLVIGLFIYGRSAEDVVAADYGVYAGVYLAVCSMAEALVSIVLMPFLGRTFAGIRREDSRFARTAFQSGVHICLVYGIFLTVYVAVMGAQLAELLCPEGKETVVGMLLGGSSLILFMVLVSYFKRFLQIAGKKALVAGAVGLADVVFALIVLLTSGIGKAGILSLVYGGLAGMLVLCILLGLFSYRQMRMKMDWLQVCLIPLGAGGAAGILFAILGRLLAPLLGAAVTLLVVFAVVGMVYWIGLLLLRNFREQELSGLLGGRFIIALGQRLHLL